MVGPVWFQTLVGVAGGIAVILACLVLLGLLVAGALAWREIHRARVRLAVLQREAAPALQSLRRLVEHLETASGVLRADAEAVHSVVIEATDGAKAGLHAVEHRLQRLGVAAGAAQDEIEEALVDVVATARGVRAGAAVLRGILGVVGGADGSSPRHQRGRPSPAPDEMMEDDDEATDADYQPTHRREEAAARRGRPRARSRRPD